MDRCTHSLRGVGDQRRQLATERMGKTHVPDDPVSEERADARLRAIEELIGHEQVERFVFLFQAADSARRDNPLYAEDLEAVDVGAEVELGWQDAVPHAMTREEGDLLAPQRGG